MKRGGGGGEGGKVGGFIFTIRLHLALVLTPQPCSLFSPPCNSLPCYSPTASVSCSVVYYTFQSVQSFYC